MTNSSGAPLEARPWAGQTSEPLGCLLPSPSPPASEASPTVPHTHMAPHAIPSQLPPSLRKGLPLGGSGAGFVGPEPLAVPRQGPLAAKGGSLLPDTPCRNMGQVSQRDRVGCPLQQAHDGMAGRHANQPPLPAIPARRASSFKYAVATFGEMDLVNERGA